jgi:hypothetical protein
MNSLLRRLNAPALAALALCALPSIAAAQCGLEIKAYPKVLLPGQTAKVDVYARSPFGAYAFAASSFDVAASLPSWAWVSDGAVVGGNVLGINSSQPHQPALGVLADPQNPYHAWTGRFRPQSNAPALVSFQALPTDFWYYPSKYTSSSAQCSPMGSQTSIYVNPLRSGPFAAAPGEGTALQSIRGGFLAESAGDSMLMGLLLPAVQVPRESAVVTRFDVPPTSFTTTSEVATDSLSLNFTKITYRQVENDGSYEVLADIQNATDTRMIVHMADGSVRTISAGVNGVFPVRLDRIPDSLATKVSPQANAARPEQIELLSWSFSASDTRGSLTIILPDGVPAVCHGVTVLAYARVDGVSPMQNNIKQLALAAHNYESTGARQMLISPALR